MFEFIVFCYSRTPRTVCKAVWENPVIGEELKCQREIGNSHDPLVVAVVKQLDERNTIVGHVSQRISASCTAFIRRGGIIQCTVTGSRRYNVDLIKGSALQVAAHNRFILSGILQKDRDFSLCHIISNCYIFFSKANFHD